MEPNPEIGICYRFLKALTEFLKTWISNRMLPSSPGEDKRFGSEACADPLVSFRTESRRRTKIAWTLLKRLK
jgi:hypothetical protein